MFNRDLTGSAWAHFAVLMVVIFWASAFVAIRYCVGVFSPLNLALDRLLVALLVMLPIFLVSRYHQRPTHSAAVPMRAHILLALIGTVCMGLYFLFLNLGELTVTSGFASFLIAQSPLLVILISVLLFREKLSTVSWCGLGVGFIGIFIMGAQFIFSAQFTWGFLEVVIAVFISATWSLSQRYLSRYFSAVHITFMSIFYSAVSLMLFGYHAWIDALPQLYSHALPVIYLGVFPTAAAFCLWAYALSKMKASSAAGWLYIMPLITLLIAYVALHEKTSLMVCVGGLIGLLGSLLIALGRRKVAIGATES